MIFESIFAKHLRIKESEVRDFITAKSCPDWDSFTYLNIISDLEKENKISLTMDDVLNSKSIGDLRKAVEEKL